MNAIAPTKSTFMQISFFSLLKRFPFRFYLNVSQYIFVICLSILSVPYNNNDIIKMAGLISSTLFQMVRVIAMFGDGDIFSWFLTVYVRTSLRVNVRCVHLFLTYWIRLDVTLLFY